MLPMGEPPHRAHINGSMKKNSFGRTLNNVPFGPRKAKSDRAQKLQRSRGQNLSTGSLQPPGIKNNPCRLGTKHLVPRMHERLGSPHFPALVYYYITNIMSTGAVDREFLHISSLQEPPPGLLQTPPKLSQDLPKVRQRLFWAWLGPGRKLDGLTAVQIDGTS